MLTEQVKKKIVVYLMIYFVCTHFMIQTSRLRIRRLTSDDALLLSTYRSRPEVAEHQSWDIYTLEQAHSLIQEMEKSSPVQVGKWFQFGVELLSEKSLIGDIGVLNTDLEGKCWIGFTIDSKHWKKGYAFESVKAVLDFYQNINLTNFWASIDPKNSASHKLLLKLGFEIVESKPDDLVFRMKT